MRSSQALRQPMIRLSQAPMVDVSFAPFRHLIRLSSMPTTLYTPMIVSQQ